MTKRYYYKYFSKREHAEAMLNGEILFRSLSYFRSYEDGGRRGDENEGTSIFKPEGGLKGTNVTRGIDFNFKDGALKSAVREDEIFVFCLSRKLNDELREEFDAVAYVEISNIHEFCRKVTKALPSSAKFHWTEEGHRRIGHQAIYRSDADTLWAGPGWTAISKPMRYKHQDEFRLVFALTDALEFQNTDMHILLGGAKRDIPAFEPKERHVSTGSLHSICRLGEF